ncbi:MAG TPA: hypothetical protein VIH97_02650 [Candidatus Acidoferrales bacterium]
MLACFGMAEKVNNSVVAQAAAFENALKPLNHFAAMLLFALLISVAFAALGQRRGLERFRYAVWCFALFMLVGVGIAWLMYPFSR